MDLPDLLSDQLDLLSEALPDGSDLTAILAVLTDDLVAAYPSYLGFTMTLSTNSGRFVIDNRTADTAGSSILLPASSPSSDHIVLYAADPGTFLDLAAQARALFFPDEQIILDGHLDPITGSAQPTLTERSDIDQAIGVLIEAGFPPTEAAAELRHRAEHQGTSQHSAALAILHNAAPST